MPIELVVALGAVFVSVALMSGLAVFAVAVPAVADAAAPGYARVVGGVGERRADRLADVGTRSEARPLVQAPAEVREGHVAAGAAARGRRAPLDDDDGHLRQPLEIVLPLILASTTLWWFGFRSTNGWIVAAFAGSRRLPASRAVPRLQDRRAAEGRFGTACRT